MPSLLRGFSAPVILKYPYTEAELLHLMANDDDPFNRWEAGQRLATETILRAKGGKPSAAFLEAARQVLARSRPGVRRRGAGAALGELPRRADGRGRPGRAARRRATRCGASSPQALKDDLLRDYDKLDGQGPYSPDAASAGRRALRNLALGYLASSACRRSPDEQFERADNMTDSMAALSTLANLDCPERQARARRLLRAMEGRAAGGRQVAGGAGDLAAARRRSRRVKELLPHPAFDLNVPNKVYALIRGFCRQPRALPCRRRRRLRVPRRPGHRARRAQPPGRGAHGARLRPLEEVRRRPPGPCPAPRSSASATPRDCRGTWRDRRQGAGVRSVSDTE